MCVFSNQAWFDSWLEIAEDDGLQRPFIQSLLLECVVCMYKHDWNALKNIYKHTCCTVFQLVLVGRPLKAERPLKKNSQYERRPFWIVLKRNPRRNIYHQAISTWYRPGGGLIIAFRSPHQTFFCLISGSLQVDVTLISLSGWFMLMSGRFRVAH